MFSSEIQGKKVKLYFRMDGSGFFLLSAAEQIEKYEEWVEVPVEKPKEEEKKEETAKPEEKGEPMDTDKSQETEKMDTSTNSEEGKAEDKRKYIIMPNWLFDKFCVIFEPPKNLLALTRYVSYNRMI